MAVVFDQVISYFYFNILALIMRNLYIHRKFTYGTITLYFFHRPAAVEAEKKAFMSDVAKVGTLLIQSGEIYK